jgi:hypothetical protein
VYRYKPATGDCKLDTKVVAVVCTKYYAECMKFLTQKAHPTCTPIFLGPNVGYATVFTYHDKDGSCRLNMKELQKLCKENYQECVSFLKASQKPKCDPIDLGPGIGKQKVLQWYDDTANCRINMRELKKVCKSKFQQCLAFIDKPSRAPGRPVTVKEVCQNVDGAKCSIFAQDGATKLAVGSNDKAASKECSSISSALAQSALGMSSGAKKCKAGSTISRVAMQKGSYATGVVTVKGLNMKGGRGSMLAGETMYELSVKLSGGASTVYAVKDMKLPPSAFQAISYNRPGVPSTGLARSQDCHFSGVDSFLLGPRGKAFLSEDPLSHSWVSIGTDTASFAGKTWNVGNMQEAGRRTFLIQNNFMGAVNTWGTKKGSFAGSIVFIANSNPQSYQSTNKIKLSSGVVVAQVTSKAAKGYKGSMGVLGLGTCSVNQCKKSTPATWEQSTVAFNFP